MIQYENTQVETKRHQSIPPMWWWEGNNHIPHANTQITSQNKTRRGKGWRNGWKNNISGNNEGSAFTHGCISTRLGGSGHTRLTPLITTGRNISTKDWQMEFWGGITLSSMATGAKYVPPTKRRPWYQWLLGLAPNSAHMGCILDTLGILQFKHDAKVKKTLCARGILVTMQSLKA